MLCARCSTVIRRHLKASPRQHNETAFVIINGIIVIAAPSTSAGVADVVHHERIQPNSTFHSKQALIRLNLSIQDRRANTNESLHSSVSSCNNPALGLKVENKD
ncbi:hypothetical protein ACFX1T_007529 [Malus domestica]